MTPLKLVELNKLSDDLKASIARRDKNHVMPATMEVAQSTSEALLFLDRARLALDAALDFQAVRECRDMSVALAAYAREARDTSLLDKAARLRVEAERRAGAMLAASGALRAKGARDEGAPRLKLSDIGISAVQSSVWQQMAALPDSLFSDAMAQATQPGKLLTSVKVMAAARAIQPPPPREVPMGAPSHRSRPKSALVTAVRQVQEVLATRTGALLTEEKTELLKLYEAIEVVLVDDRG
jgi:hypothetical protein